MTIDVYFERLTENRKAEMRITRSIVSEDMMADEASPALADIRRKKKNGFKQNKKILCRNIQAVHIVNIFRENIVTTRGGRFVVPVKLENKMKSKDLYMTPRLPGHCIYRAHVGCRGK